MIFNDCPSLSFLAGIPVSLEEDGEDGEGRRDWWGREGGMGHATLAWRLFQSTVGAKLSGYTIIRFSSAKVEKQ